MIPIETAGCSRFRTVQSPQASKTSRAARTSGFCGRGASAAGSGAAAARTRRAATPRTEIRQARDIPKPPSSVAGFLKPSGYGHRQAPRREALRLNEDAVRNSRNDEPLAALPPFVPGAGDLFRGADQGPPEEQDLFQSRSPLELGSRRTRAERGDLHARAARLVGDGLGKREQVRLRRVIDGHEGPRLKGRRRGDVQDAAALTLEHPGKKERREMRRSRDVDLDDLKLRRDGRLR